MTSIADIQDAVRAAQRIRVRGGGSKPALSNRADEGARILDLSTVQGILDYQADEYTFTARAGTPIADVAAMLAEKGQYLPFDPPLAERGATLGGTVAAGLSGAGRYRYGGIRDFLIGIRFIDGQGQEARGGGTVVKNAAGFDFPKLFVGSLGRLGILTELTFKVFPQPPAYATVVAEFHTLADLLSSLNAVTRSSIDLQAVDFAPTDDGWTLWVRIGGLISTLEQRAQALQAVTSSGAGRSDRPGDKVGHTPPTAGTPRHRDLLFGQDDEELWRQAQSMAWLPDGIGLVKVPLTPQRIPEVEKAASSREAVVRRYSVGGNLLWLGWPDEPAPADDAAVPPDQRLTTDSYDCAHASRVMNAGRQEPPSDLHSLLVGLDLQGVQLIGRAWPRPEQAQGPLLGKPLRNAFLQRIAAALDPAGKFDPW